MAANVPRGPRQEDKWTFLFKILLLYVGLHQQSLDSFYRRAANAVSALLNIVPHALGHRNQVPHAQRNSAGKSEQSEKSGIQ